MNEQDGGAEAVRSCHTERRNRLASLADDLLDCYMAGRSGQAAKDRLVDFVGGKVLEQIAAEDDAFRPIAATSGGAGLVDALPASPALIRDLVREITDNHTDVAVAAVTGALVLLMDARAAIEDAVLLPAVSRSPDRTTTLASLLNCCGSGATGANIASTAFGVFNLSPGATDALIPRNYGRGPSQFTVNLRASRTWGFGERNSGTTTQQPGGDGPMRGGMPPMGGGGGGGMRGGGGGGMRGGGGPGGPGGQWGPPGAIPPGAPAPAAPGAPGPSQIPSSVSPSHPATP